MRQPPSLLSPLLLALLLCGTAAASPRPDTAVQFLGWSPDGVSYAFVRHRTAHMEDGRTETSERTFLRDVDEDLKERTLPLSDEEVRATVEAEGYVVAPMSRRPAGELAWIFVDEEGNVRLRFSVIVGEGLSWEMATRGLDGKRRTLAARPMDDLYVDFEPDVYVAPGGDRALLVVGMRAPFRHAADLVLLPLGAPPVPVLDLPAARAAALAANPAADTEPAPEEKPIIEEGDLVLRWEETDAVTPVIVEEEDPAVAALEAALKAKAEEEARAAAATKLEAAPEETPAKGGDAQTVPPAKGGDAQAVAPAKGGDAQAVAPAKRGDAQTVAPAKRGDDEAPIDDPLSLPPVAQDPDILPPFREADEAPLESEAPEGGVASNVPRAAERSEEPKPEPKPVAKPKPKPAAKPKPEPKPVAKPAAKPEPKPVAKPAAKPEPKPVAKPAAKPELKPPQSAPASPPSATAPSPAETLTLLGFVKAADIYGGKPIAGATVTLSTGQTATTNKRGLYTLQVKAGAGTITVTASARGYEPWSEPKDIEPGAENWKSLALIKPGQERPAPQTP